VRDADTALYRLERNPLSDDGPPAGRRADSTGQKTPRSVVAPRNAGTANDAVCGNQEVSPRASADAGATRTESTQK